MLKYFNKNKKISYKQFLRYYRFAILLQDREVYELLLSVVPYNLNKETEEKYYELQGALKYKLMYNHHCN